MSDNENLPADSENEEQDENNFPSEWNLSDEGLQNIQRSMTEQKTKHGLYAGIPMICLDDKCPYKVTCGFYQEGNAPSGERCPKEIALIMNLYDRYVAQLGLDEKDMVQLSLLKEVIDLDIKIDRAERKQAAEPDLVKDVPVAVDDRGRVIRKPEVDKVTEVADKLMDRRHKILSYLNATPKDKAASKLEITQDPSTYAAKLMARKQKLDEENTVEVQADESVEETED